MTRYAFSIRDLHCNGKGRIFSELALKVNLLWIYYIADQNPVIAVLLLTNILLCNGQC